MDTPARDSKYIQLVCLKSSGMEIIYLHWKSTPNSITFASIVCACASLTLCYIYILSDIFIYSSIQISLTLGRLCVPVCLSLLTSTNEALKYSYAE